jgi:hypothetical protein
MRDSKKGWPLAILFVGLITLSACGGEKKNAEEQEPIAEETEQMENQPVKNADSLSTDKETIDVDMSKVNSLKKGDSFIIQKADGSESFNLKVRRVQETIPGITSISANIEDQGTGLASLLLRDGKLTGLMDLYKARTRYRVGYDSVAGAHYVQEVLREEMDIKEGSAPLVPDREGQ